MDGCVNGEGGSVEDDENVLKMDVHDGYTTV